MGVGMPALGQSGETVSRAVVQPLPPAAADDLNGALLRLARDRRDVDALITAGLASLELDDAAAAIGFFGRAKELSPENPRIAEGMAAAYVRGGRPVEALKLFEEAEQAGIASGSMWADRGLAHDLVGQNEAAQSAYRRALSLKDDSAVRQRMALSYAIAGERSAFEDTLKPLLDARDFAAYRTRAFGLAILDDADEAIEIARAVMPRDLAGRMEPYLRFMPRLTRSQQAAAANLGIYPSASRIGRDEPRIADAAGVIGPRTTSDGTLEPRGEPLGSAAAGDAAVPVPAQATQQVAVQMPAPARQASGSRPAPTGPATAQEPGTRQAAAQAPAAIAATTEPPAASTPENTASERVAVTTVDPGQPESRQSNAASFDLAQAQQAGSGADPAAVPTTAQAASAGSATGQMDLADAFADFSQPTVVKVAGEDVVDISAIEPVREVEAAPEPPPAPRRIWLQLGIGQNRSLLRSDWRLKYRKFDVLKGKGPYVTPWGQTNRLLAGPFDSQSAAREALNALASEEIDSFVWTSAEGQEIEDLR